MPETHGIYEAEQLLRYAVEQTCPAALGILKNGKSRVQPNKKIGSADVISRAALSVFSFLLSAPQAAKHSALSTSPNQPEEDVEHRKVKRPKLASHSAPKAEKGNDKEPAEVCQCAAGKQTSVQVTTTSEYGLERTCIYQSSDELAAALVKCFEQGSEELRCTFREFRVGPRSEVLFLTWKHWESQQAAGMLLCPACGQFYGGERGLRTHQQAKHATDYGVAKEVVETAKQQLIVRSSSLLPTVPAPHQPTPSDETRNSTPAPGMSKTVLSPEFEAASTGNEPILRKFVTEGWNPHEEDKHGSNALLWAAGGGHLGVCKFLVEECGILVEYGDTSGSTAGKQALKRRRNALHWAARHGHIEVCKWLVEKGCDVNVATQDGTVALHYAVWQEHIHICKWLVYEAGCSLAHCNSFGCNAMQWAAQTDSLDMCRWLAASGLDIGVINNNGHSALHKAAIKGQSRVCGWLLNEECLGLKHLQADRDGNTPAVMARLEGHTDLADALDSAQKLLARAELEGPDIMQPEGPFKVPESEACSSDAATKDSEGAAAYGAIRKGSSLSEISSSIRRARLCQRNVQDAHDDIHQDAATHGNANRLPKGWTNFNTSSSNGPVEQQQQPLVSIVLPVYNGEAFLQECLHSITMQSHRPLELAVCDNGSTDSTPIILAAWRPKLEAVGIQYVCVTTGDADPRGCGYGRNRCIEAASGQWICSADADDIMLPSRVSMQLTAALAAPPKTLLGCRFVREPNTATWCYALWANSMTQQDLWLQQYRECTVVQPTWFYHRSVWDAAGPFAVTPEENMEPSGAQRALADDLRFIHNHIRLGGCIRRLDNVLVMYRHHGGQLSTTTPVSLLRKVRAHAFEERVLCSWPHFSVWGAGRDAKAFLSCLSEESQRKVAAVAEIDPAKIGTVFDSAAALKVRAPIVHWREVKAPVVVCVARGRTGGELEANVRKVGLREGIDCWFVV